MLYTNHYGQRARIAGDPAVEFDPTPPGLFAADPPPEFVALLKDRNPLTLGPDVAGPRARTALRPITGVTYNGHPLDTYAADQAPGQTSGLGLDDFGRVVRPFARGDKIDNG
jgi:hypothetical protein